MLLICQTFAPWLRKGVTISTYSFNERESAVHEDVPDKMLLFLFGDRFKAIFTLYRITISSYAVYRIVWTATAQIRNKSLTHIKQRAERLAERVWWTASQPSPLNFRLSTIQSSLYLFTSATVQMNCLHCTKVWHRTYQICDASLSRSQQARLRFAP